MATAVLALTLLAAPAANGEEVFTGQAAAARATDSTWIPAPAVRAAVCIVDTGNDVNPDTANVVARFAVDGGDGGDLHPDHHGTLMAMIASAPHDGFGMVGAAPSINVVSVRASRDGSSFGSLDVTAAIQKCVNKAEKYNIKVISLSLGGRIDSGLDAASMSATQDAVDNARRAGLSVVAAAGNRPGPVDWPAGYGPVMAIGAADASGARCGFAASGPEVDLWTLGCPQDVALMDGRAAWASGSSETAAFVAGVLTQLRALRPELSAADSEQLLSASAAGGPAGPSLDVDALFRRAGLQQALALGASVRPPGSVASSEGISARPTSSVAGRDAGFEPPRIALDTLVPAVADTAAPAAQTARLRLAQPKCRLLRVRNGVLTLILANRPRDARVRVQIFVRTRNRAFPVRMRALTSTHDRLRTRVLGTVSQVSMTYIDPSGRKDPSPSVSVRPRK